MANQVGVLIKEARTLAGMTEAELAEKVEIVSAEDIIGAENGAVKLSQRQLKAVAKATGVTQKSLLDASREPVPEENAQTAAMTDEELIKLYNAAGEDAKKAAVSMLKGEQPQKPDIMGMFMKMMANGDIMNKIKGFLGSDMGKSLMNGAKNIFGGENNNERYGRSMSVPLMAFTYFYTISHYILLLSFYFWLWRKDIKPEK